jgi:pyruvate, orthophosphate dikinase
MTFGFSRDDVEARIMPTYLEHHLLEVDPFTTLDPTGVGRLVRLAVEEGGQRDPTSTSASAASTGATRSPSILCHEIGLDYVSCSPVPGADRPARRRARRARDRRARHERLSHPPRSTSLGAVRRGRRSPPR